MKKILTLLIAIISFNSFAHENNNSGIVYARNLFSVEKGGVIRLISKKMTPFAKRYGDHKMTRREIRLINRRSYNEQAFIKNMILYLAKNHRVTPLALMEANQWNSFASLESFQLGEIISIPIYTDPPEPKKEEEKKPAPKKETTTAKTDNKKIKPENKSAEKQDSSSNKKEASTEKTNPKDVSEEKTTTDKSKAPTSESKPKIVEEKQDKPATDKQEKLF